MGLFRRKSSKAITPETLPDWDDTRWRSHLRSNALGTDHHCGIYVDMINADRKEAARLYRNDDHARARTLAESSIRNNRVVTALAALSPLCNALYQRSEPLAGYTTLVQVPEPARSGIVTIVFAASRLQMPFLADTVAFLKEQFGPIHIDQIQKGEGDLYPLVNATVRDALSAVPATRAEIDHELAACVKQHFGIAIQTESRPRAAAAAAQNDLRRSQTTPVSQQSSELGAPISPQLSQQRARADSPPPQPTRLYRGSPGEDGARVTTPPRQDVGRTTPTRRDVGRSTEDVGGGVALEGGGMATRQVEVGRTSPRGFEVGRGTPPRYGYLGGEGETRLIREERGVPERGVPERGVQEERGLPEHRRVFKDSDEMLLAQYEHLRAVIST